MFKILGIGFIGIICYKLIKNVKPDLSVLIIIATGAIILISLSDYVVEIFNFFTDLSDKSRIGNTIFASLIKIIGIGYITEYSTELCNDCGCSSIGKKIELAGKLMIFIMALPIIREIIKILGVLL